jgi:uncharacterized protein YndB with AHSA1/START domain
VVADLFIKQIYIDAPRQVVFAFLTDPVNMVRWMGVQAELDPEPGGVISPGSQWP